jgi:N6-L-threonylcarbamoyladenine synthase
MKKADNLTILGIETSCDDTCIAILEVKKEKIKVLSNIISSQVKLHAKYGGVYPSLAKREHQKNLPLVLNKALKKSGLKISDIDLIAVTIGPGLEPCLWTGINFAKEIGEEGKPSSSPTELLQSKSEGKEEREALFAFANTRVAEKSKISIVPVNHIEAHILINFLSYYTKDNYKSLKKDFLPAICLIVSGGHTQLILLDKIKDNWKYKIIGETRDDAAGECLDKSARILGLGYPGGPAIAEQAQQWKSQFLIIEENKFSSSPSFLLGKNSVSNPQTNPNPPAGGQITKIKLPRPMLQARNYDFSFSGLKTAVLYKVKSQKRKARSKKYIQAMCVEIQQAVIDVLIKKTIKAARDYQAKSIILGGGVASNQELRKQLGKACLKFGFKYSAPTKDLCTDNGLMTALAGYLNPKQINSLKKIKANSNLKAGQKI